MKVIHILYTVIAVVIIALLAYVSVLFPVVPITATIMETALAAAIYFSPKVSWLGRIFLPQPFVSEDLDGYGIKERNWFVKLLTDIVMIVDGVTCALLSAIFKKKIVWMIRPTRLTVNIRAGNEWTAPLHPEYRSTDGKNSFPADEWKKLYLGERAALLRELIKRAGWRATFYSSVIEHPVGEIVDFRQDTEFIVY